MSAHVFSESGQMEEVDITEIFDVLEGGEDEGAVKYLLGFGGNNGASNNNEVGGSPHSKLQTPTTRTTTMPSSSSRLATQGTLKATFPCNSCGKVFTTKFNLKRHINMHCHQSKELGVPIQGPPSASAPPTKKIIRPPMPFVQQRSVYGSSTASASSSSNMVMTIPSNLSFQTPEGATVSLGMQDQRLQQGAISKSLGGSASQSLRSASPRTHVTSSSSSEDEEKTEDDDDDDEDDNRHRRSNVPQQPVVADSISVTVNLNANELGCMPLQMPAICGEDVRKHLLATRPKAIGDDSDSDDDDDDDDDEEEEEEEEEDNEDDDEDTYEGHHVQRKQQLKVLYKVPDGWKRRIIDEKVVFFNMAGKKFEEAGQVRHHLHKLGYTLHNERIFDFGNHAQRHQAFHTTDTMPKRAEEDDDGGKSDEDLREDAGTGDDNNKPKMLSGGDRAVSPEITSRPSKRRRVDPQQQMQWLYDFLRRFKREDGCEVCELFIRAPKRRSDPKYYEIVSDPIDMLRIQQKLKTDEYNELNEITDDFNRLIDNAVKYYEHTNGQQEKEAALEMRSLLNKALAKIEVGEDPNIALGDREGDNNELFEMADELLGAVMTATDPTDAERLVHTVFRLLPSQKRYPEYYDVISDPTDLKTVATRIQSGSYYESLNAVEEDLNLVFRNAMSFNEPGSQIYRDAKYLVKVVKSKKLEIEANKVARENRGLRTTRRTHGKRNFSAELSDLSYEDSESDVSEEEDSFPPGDPLWDLYAHVRNFETSAGVSLGEPFFSLPSKRELPEYYEIITRPISLNHIRKKLKNGDYKGDLNSMASDLTLMFENCKLYNRPESRLYKDGAKLQRAMNLKLQELSTIKESGGVGSLTEDSCSGSSRYASPLKKRLRSLYNSVLNYRNRDGIPLVGMFMEKPDKNDYPDYYEVISNPMDMSTINDRIKGGQYRTEDELMSDMRLMFSNCRKYNEEGSDIYDDSLTLEKALMSKAKELGLQFSLRRSKQMKSKGSVNVCSSMNLHEKLKTLYETLRDHKDAKGRQLSLIFLKLPNPKEFPDYFEVIKTPIDFERISTKIKQNGYDSIDECLSDFTLVFDNACKYNEPDSQIYKDSLTLQSLAHRTCRTLNEDNGSSVPDVQATVQEMLNFIFISMYNAQDSDERCLSDSLAELPEHDEIDGRKIRALSLDLIKRRLDRGLYKRLDTFQKDVFAVFERARQLTRSDSQIFEDAVELQNQFIRLRDEACENGDVLQSRALLSGVDELRSSVEALKEQKRANEQPEEIDEGVVKDETTSNDGYQSAFVGELQEQYRVGEFVYVDLDQNGSKAIILIEKIIQDENMVRSGEDTVDGKVGDTTQGSNVVIRGNSFYRPVETFHVSSRKFIENEVFRTDQHVTFAPDQIRGRCIVVPIREFFRSTPKGFDSQDVYVCESRYSAKARSFKKMKMAWETPSYITMEPRSEPYEPKRVMSVFKERIERHKEELEEIEAMINNVDECLPPNVLWMNPDGPQQGLVYYEQYTIPGPITLRRGDTVYVRAENGKSLIAQIDTMWTAEDGMAYFHGLWFVTPKEMNVGPEALFYKQEAFLSTISDTNPLLSVVGKCAVMEMNEYVVSRPTQYTETDVYVCESVYDESKRCVRGPLPNGLKQYEYSTAVTTDEVFFFKSAISIKKEPLIQPVNPVTSVASSPTSKSNNVLCTTPTSKPPTMTLTTTTMISTNTTNTISTTSNMEVDNEDSLDAPPSVASSDTPTTTTASTKKVKTGSNRKMVTPYILFSCEVRRSVAEENKWCSFGEISRLVGDRKAKSRNGYQIFSSEAWVQVKQTMPKTATFAEISRKIGNQWRQLSDAEKQVYEEKSKKLNEENAMKYAEELKNVEERRKADAASSTTTLRASMTAPAVTNGVVVRHQSGGSLSPGQQANRPPSQPGPVVSRGAEPIFHTVPPRPQRLLHSEAYIRYIEGLSCDSQTMSNWDRQLNASKSNTRVEEAKLPAHWLADTGEHSTSTDALWALRDFMMGDTLNLYRINKVT